MSPGALPLGEVPVVAGQPGACRGTSYFLLSGRSTPPRRVAHRLGDGAGPPDKDGAGLGEGVDPFSGRLGQWGLPGVEKVRVQDGPGFLSAHNLCQRSGDLCNLGGQGPDFPGNDSLLLSELLDVFGYPRLGGEELGHALEVRHHAKAEETLEELPRLSSRLPLLAQDMGSRAAAGRLGDRIVMRQLHVGVPRLPQHRRCEQGMRSRYRESAEPRCVLLEGVEVDRTEGVGWGLNRADPLDSVGVERVVPVGEWGGRADQSDLLHEDGPR